MRACVYPPTSPRIPSSRSTWAHLLDITPALFRSKALERVELGNGCSSFQSVSRMRRALEREVLEGSNTGGELLGELVLVEVLDLMQLTFFIE